MSKKEHILTVAETLFNQYGYHAVGVDRIRDEAEVSKTSMYRHFGSKTKLIEAVLEQRHQRFAASIQAQLEPTHTTLQRLDALLAWHFQWFARPDFKGCLFMHALSEFQSTDEGISACARAHKQWLKMQILNALALDESRDVPSRDHGAERLMIFFEGIIVRSEFESTDAFQADYRAFMHQIAGLNA